MAQDPPQVDTLYQSYDKGLRRLTGDEGSDSIIEMLQPQPGIDNSAAVEVSASDIGSGTSTGTAAAASGSQQSGKQTFDNTVTGYILGLDPKDGFAKFYIGNSTKYINWDGVNLTVVGGVSISSLDIPDTVTANSFHVDVSGNSWWGATTLGAATGKVLNTGAATFSNMTITGGSININGGTMSLDNSGNAVFKSVSIGGSGIQYTINDNGVFNFGDGSDGAGTADGSTALAGATLGGGNYTLTRDIYLTNLTVSTGVTIFPAGYRIFGNGTLTMNGTAKIDTSGGNGSDGAQVAYGPGGAGVAAGYLSASGAGGDGNYQSDGGTPTHAGQPGVSPSNSIDTGATGGSGGNGGHAGGSSGGSPGQGGGTPTASNVKLIANWHLATLLDIGSTGSTIKFTPGGSGGGGGAGETGDTGNRLPGGGGGGGAGGIIAVYFRIITIGASAILSAKGGNGGKGGDGVNCFSRGTGGAGGGGGGAGGVIILVYNTLNNSGSLLVTGGTHGNGGTATGQGTPGSVGGTNGTDGSAGTIYQFKISL